MIKRIISSIPNSITCCNLLSGVLACIASFHIAEENLLWSLNGLQLAWLLIGAATVFDFCDGFAARLLRAHSLLGKELDSLADLVSFGIAPAMMMYNLLLSLQSPAWLPWIALCLPVLGALRLAKFNIDDRQTTSFIGLPIPSNAIFWIGYSAWLTSDLSPLAPDMIMQGWCVWLTAVLLSLIALSMVSGLPMFSLKFKSMNPRVNVDRYIIIASAFVFVFLLGLTGLALSILLYFIISIIEWARSKQRNF